MKFNSYDIRVFDAFCHVADTSLSSRDLTMTRIADELGISRQALNQAGYHKISDVLNTLHSYIDQDINKKIEEHKNNQSEHPMQFFALEILPLIYKKRRYLKTIYWHIADPEWRKFAGDHYAEALYPYLEYSAQKYDLSKEFLAKIFIGQVLSIIACWLKQENPESPEEFAEKFLFLTRQSIIDLLQN